MRQLIILVTSFFCLTNALAQDDLHVTTANNLKMIAESYVKEGKPDKVTVLYNAFNLVLEKVSDKQKLKSQVEYFENIIGLNRASFVPVLISTGSAPISIPNKECKFDLKFLKCIQPSYVNIKSTDGWTHNEIHQLLELLNKKKPGELSVAIDRFQKSLVTPQDKAPGEAK
ncbi:hypothetical protein [Undibacterium danionis]|uniref:Uncharacterized protein n=1 Tax=Undibacterium danionis TaxID=1812100 RepID=A0ABV6IF07_9BURK